MKNAKTLYEQALALFRQVGDLQYQGFVNNNIFHLLIHQNQYDEAQKYNEEAMRCFQATQFIHGFGLVSSNQGEFLISQKKYTDAEQVFQQSILYSEQSGLEWDIAYGYWQISQSQLFRKQDLRASLSALKAIQIIQSGKSEDWLIWFCLSIWPPPYPNSIPIWPPGCMEKPWLRFKNWVKKCSPRISSQPRRSSFAPGIRSAQKLMLAHRPKEPRRASMICSRKCQKGNHFHRPNRRTHPRRHSPR